MTRDVRPLAHVIAHDIWNVESGQDRQIVKVAQFIATMAEARIASRTPAEISQAAILRAGEAIRLQIEARAKLIELHGELQTIAALVGLPELATGGAPKPDPGTYAPPSPRELPEEMAVSADLV